LPRYSCLGDKETAFIEIFAILFFIKVILIKMKVMPRIIYLLVITLLSSFLTSAQEIERVDTLKYSTSNRLRGITLDDKGDIIIIGTFSEGYSGNVANARRFILKMDPTCEIAWVEKNTSASSYFTNVVADGFNNLYTSIYVDDLNGMTPQIAGIVQEVGTYLVKYSEQGTVMWVSPKQEPHTLPDMIVLNKDGNIEVRSNRAGGNANHIYNANGHLLTAQMDVPILFARYDRHGNAYQLFGDYFVKYDPSGNQLWLVKINNGYTKFIIDADGNCYLTEQGPYMASKVFKLNSNGQVIWTKNFAVECAFVASTDGNNLYLAGVFGTPDVVQGGIIKKLDINNGNVLWSTQIPIPDFRPVDVCTANGNIYTAANSQDESKECYLVKVTDQDWTPPTTTSIKRHVNESTFSIFPNPSSSHFSIQYSGNATGGNVQIRILDVTGKQVYHQTLSGFDGENLETISLDHLPKGVYLMELTSDGKKESKKLVLD
jgi:hypothetical protein